jgi:hypothetical protein
LRVVNNIQKLLMLPVEGPSLIYGVDPVPEHVLGLEGSGQIIPTNLQSLTLSKGRRVLGVVYNIQKLLILPEPVEGVEGFDKFS